ncbi:hypothetical protein XELAEV_18008220mg [Xenopus laevis]|uniref:Uncharacterized protein n=1 Tax=Xenopus laevis TaxID=8355 RepID=A0A974I5T6_XENLA|nr:hypothetical protein XELAEV_18008220mg [Xenopus laevis]
METSKHLLVFIFFILFLIQTSKFQIAEAFNKNDENVIALSRTKKNHIFKQGKPSVAPPVNAGDDEVKCIPDEPEIPDLFADEMDSTKKLIIYSGCGVLGFIAVAVLIYIFVIKRFFKKKTDTKTDGLKEAEEGEAGLVTIDTNEKETQEGVQVKRKKRVKKKVKNDEEETQERVEEEETQERVQVKRKKKVKKKVINDDDETQERVQVKRKKRVKKKVINDDDETQERVEEEETQERVQVKRKKKVKKKVKNDEEETQERVEVEETQERVQVKKKKKVKKNENNDEVEAETQKRVKVKRKKKKVIDATNEIEEAAEEAPERTKVMKKKKTVKRIKKRKVQENEEESSE